jgi:hypothetical protein
MAHATLALLNGVYLSGHIPDGWESNIIVPIYKQGDETDPGNYRGIALMNTALKVRCAMLNRRLSDLIEQLKLLKPHQAGFGPAEESVAQAACLVELLQRRTAQDKETLVAFVDFVKVYHYVPHEALFHKLEHKFAVHGTALRFLRALYASSCCRVRVGSGANASFSDLINCLRGLRQGCVLSPLLFNIFVDDVFDDVDELLPQGGGVPVPGFPDDFQIPGLLFADDLTVLAPNQETMQERNQSLLSWAADNEMDVNIRKCGLMHFGPNHEAFLAAAATSTALLDVDAAGHPRTDCFWFNGQLLPISKYYIYLGVYIERSLSYDAMFAHRLEKTEEASKCTFPLMHSWTVPMELRITVLKTVIYSGLLYGCEITGGSQVRVAPAQTFANNLLRVILSVSVNPQGRYTAGVPVRAMWRELCCPLYMLWLLRGGVVFTSRQNAVVLRHT